MYLVFLSAIGLMPFHKVNYSGEKIYTVSGPGGPMQGPNNPNWGQQNMGGPQNMGMPGGPPPNQGFNQQQFRGRMPGPGQRGRGGRPPPMNRGGGKGKT